MDRLFHIFDILFQSTLPLRGATVTLRPQSLIRRISIHAPLTGSDTGSANTEPESTISIHAPLTGSDYSAMTICLSADISIHAPLTGSDRNYLIFWSPEKIFQSTLPLRGATLTPNPCQLSVPISIHAPLTGSDRTAAIIRHSWMHFNPRSPYGERLTITVQERECRIFQSTLPLRGATDSIANCSFQIRISIHAPLTGSDPQGDSPARIDEISIHAPLTGSDLGTGGTYTYPLISIHAPLTGSDSIRGHGRRMVRYFNPRSPYGERP